jgi:hypothetical protein
MRRTKSLHNALQYEPKQDDEEKDKTGDEMLRMPTTPLVERSESHDKDEFDVEEEDYEEA